MSESTQTIESNSYIIRNIHIYLRMYVYEVGGRGGTWEAVSRAGPTLGARPLRRPDNYTPCWRNHLVFTAQTPKRESE